MEQTPTALPLSWHPDGTPIFERGDFIRQARPLLPDESSLIYDEIILPEHKHLKPELSYNLIVVSQTSTEMATTGWIGKSYPDEKRGYLYPRIIQALDSNCRILLQRCNMKGKVTNFVMLSMAPLQLAVIPPKYETIVANPSVDGPARFFELQAREEKRYTESLIELDGPGYKLKKEGGLNPNSNYDELSIPRIQPGLSSFRFLKRRPLYEMLTSFPKGFDFIDPPRPEFFIGAV